ncbi:MAG: polyprenol monophosphomannose synthase [Chloroflexi bacterium]|nr:polyprenol monophosphomannose synthase [Chloroflexota bacterium]
MSQGSQRVSIIIPTYNEVENVGPLISELGSTLGDKDYQILVVDDSSPDGTYEAVEEIAAQNSRVQGIKRPGKLGLASAVLDGFRASDGDLVVMMDSDLSHRPQDLGALLEASEDADIVIGSRYVKGSSIIGLSPYRHLASRTSIWLSKVMLGLPFRDTTSGFAVFRREVLEPLASGMNPVGFKLLLEVLVMCPQARVKEVPITFVNRKRGKSKFGVREVLVFLRLCNTLRSHRRSVTASVE